MVFKLGQIFRVLQYCNCFMFKHILLDGTAKVTRRASVGRACGFQRARTKRSRRRRSRMHVGNRAGGPMYAEETKQVQAAVLVRAGNETCAQSRCGRSDTNVRSEVQALALP